MRNNNGTRSLYHNYQFEFCARALKGNTPNKIPYIKKYTPREQTARLNIYRNNIYCSLIDVLANTYPAIKTIIGATLFRHAAKAFIDAHPPQSAVMLNYGSEFSEFIASYSPTQKLVFLPHLAKLELAHHQAYYAQDATPLPATTFAEIDIETLSNSRITPHPSAALICSPFAIYSIWKNALENGLTGSNIDNNTDSNLSENVLIIRPNYSIDSYPLSAALSCFFTQLLQQQTIGDALGEAITIAEQKQLPFEPAEAIQLLIGCGLCLGITDNR